MNLVSDYLIHALPHISSYSPDMVICLNNLGIVLRILLFYFWSSVWL